MLFRNGALRRAVFVCAPEAPVGAARAATATLRTPAQPVSGVSLPGCGGCRRRLRCRGRGLRRSYRTGMRDGAI
ncbi:hypothetical protein GLE_4844 [Lysobacter enzymogenes]|uniref:Uncharacterized protein n=1 Tax=Lysobacter enzymogenes TaxID=69 RepID=A0A0S2DP82_LYSEN|nr:hypothetical protein GLE_4844 [Lysobacter enzymogenes]